MSELECRALLTAYVGENEAAAQRAFEILEARYRVWLSGALRRKFPWTTHDWREDIISETSLKLWEARRRYRVQGCAAWNGFVRTVAIHCAIDHPETFSQPLPDSEGRGEPGEDFDEKELIQILDAADVLWLGMDPNLSPTVHARQKLAAQFYYLHGRSLEQIAALPAVPDSGPITPAMVTKWVRDPGVIRGMAYETLFYPPKRLTCHLLGLKESEIQMLLRNLFRPEILAPITAAVLRYRCGMDVDVIARRLLEHGKIQKEEEIHAILDSFAARMPFVTQMNRLLSSLEAHHGADASALLDHLGLWQRLAFQYRYREELTLSEIAGRIQPAARVIGKEITLETLNVWLSGHRLITRLKKACHQREEQGDTV